MLELIEKVVDEAAAWKLLPPEAPVYPVEELAGSLMVVLPPLTRVKLPTVMVGSDPEVGVAVLLPSQ